MARIFTAPLPPEMIERSIVTASVWAHIASSKFVVIANPSSDKYTRRSVADSMNHSFAMNRESERTVDRTGITILMATG